MHNAGAYGEDDAEHTEPATKPQARAEGTTRVAAVSTDARHSRCDEQAGAERGAGERAFEKALDDPEQE